MRVPALVTAAGSTVGAVGGLLLGLFADTVLVPALAVILLVPAVKLARHD
ncbi:hypothetical protein [Yinghuangia soli]|nr:hypothetical protein [Yinghuangia soli]